MVKFKKLGFRAPYQHKIQNRNRLYSLISSNDNW